MPKKPKSGAPVRPAAADQRSDSEEESASADDRSDHETDADADGAGGGIDQPAKKKEEKTPTNSNSVDLDALFKAFAFMGAANSKDDTDVPSAKDWMTTPR